MKKFFFLVMLSINLYSCQEIDDEILPILGTYEAHVVKLAGPFSLNISGLTNDDVLIEAPFDGDIWSTIEADIDNPTQAKWDINIGRQNLAPGIEIWGDGFFFNGTIQLNYTINFDGDQYDYKIIGSK
jgi:hypothetical protein